MSALVESCRSSVSRSQEAAAQRSVESCPASHGWEVSSGLLGNAAVARALDEVAELLEARNANPFRVRSYRRAAQVIRKLPEPVPDLLDREGVAGLDRLSGIGPPLAGAIEKLALTGHLPILDRLRAETAPAAVLTTVSGIGSGMAERVHEQLGIGTLEELEAAAWDGRLARVPGMGRKRIRSVIECLSGRMRRTRSIPRPQPPQDIELPSVAELLEVDREYRREAAAGKLRKIAPRRFNPTSESWLPILHTQRGRRRYTALYSNTARAHELGTTHDWVVIYLDSDSGRYQCTVITAQFGPLCGRRIIRGREAECLKHYEEIPVQVPLPFDSTGSFVHQT